MTTQFNILLTFAPNDLREVSAEARDLHKILESSGDSFEVVENLTPKSLETQIAAAGKQLHLFHFGGHATPSEMYLDDFIQLDKAKFVRLLMSGDAPLDIVFLNGCRSYGHIGALTARGVKAVIAANTSIGDRTARQLAATFYERFLVQGYPLQAAFEAAQAKHAAGYLPFVQVMHPGEGDVHTRLTGTWTLIVNAQHAYVTAWTWKQFLKAGLNQLLTKRLMEAAAPYSTEIQLRLSNAQRHDKSWEQQPRLLTPLQNLLTAKFVGVIGEQLRKLIAIGTEKGASDQMHKYVFQCGQLVKLGLDLLNFTLLTGLWEAKMASSQPFDFSAPHHEVLSQFFMDGYELSIPQRLTLFETLLQIFEVQGLQCPFVELTGFAQAHLGANTPFRRAIGAFHQRDGSNQTYEQKDAFVAEIQLIEIYVPWAFLVRYKMASIHSIDYQQVRKGEPRYRHHFHELATDSKNKQAAKKILPMPQGVETQSVWIYPESHGYEKGINLTPFVLDYNAVFLEQCARICFFVAQNPADKTIDYIYLNDQSAETLQYEKWDKEQFDSGEWLREKQHCIQFNIKSVFDVLAHIQNDLLGTSPLD